MIKQLMLAAAVMAVFLLSSASNAYAGLCADIKPAETRIYIDIVIPEPHYDLTKTKAYLTANTRDVTEKWLEKHKMEVLWKADDLKTAGLASGASRLSYRAEMYAENVDRYYAAFCTFFKEIHITVFYRTLIYIPTEYPKGTCAFKDVNRHELRHHAANKAAVEKYTKKLKQDIHELVALMEAGHVGRHQVQARYKQMEIGMHDAVEVYIKDYVRKETERLNAMVDTPEEYKRGSAVLRACKKKDGHKPPRLTSR